MATTYSSLVSLRWGRSSTRLIFRSMIRARTDEDALARVLRREEFSFLNAIAGLRPGSLDVDRQPVVGDCYSLLRVEGGDLVVDRGVVRTDVGDIEGRFLLDQPVF